MRVFWMLIGFAPALLGLSSTSAQQPAVPAQQPPIPAQQLVREVVYNELHDHQRHGYWRYWIEKHTGQSTQLEEQVETADGPLTEVISCDGHPLDDGFRRQQQARLDRLVNSPQERASHRRAYAEDEDRIGRIVALLPDAFVYEYDRAENGSQRLLFRPNPAYAPRTIESRIFHAMSGEVWIDLRMKRMAKLEGRLDDNVDFGYGLFGRLNKGGWFKLHRVQVSPTDWKTERLEVHMSGRAMLFKTIARETSEARGGFAPVPSGMSLKQAMELEEAAAISPAANAFATPVSFKRP